jgi:hypothetical protein
MAIFGRSGAQLVPLFGDLQGRMAEVRAQAERLGFVLSGDQVKSVDAMGDAIDTAKMAFVGIIRQVTAGLAPAITEVANLWTSFVEATGGVNIGAGIVELLLDGAEVVARVFDYAAGVFRPVWDYARQVVNELGGVSVVWQGVMIVVNSITLAFQGVVRGLQGVGSAVAAAIYKLMKYVFEGAAFVASKLGYDELAKNLENAAATSNDLAGQAFANMGEQFTQAGANFVGAVDNLWKPEQYGFAMGDAAAGTFEDGIESFRERLRAGQSDAAKQVKAAGDGAAGAISAVVETKLASALDARSTAGTQELLRMMYGSPNRVEEQQLQVQERMADGIDQMNENLEDGMVEAFAF